MEPEDQVKDQDINTMLYYHTVDELNCSGQISNKKDVVSVEIEGETQCVLKCIVTPYLQEAYCIYKLAHSSSAVGMTNAVLLHQQ